MEISCGHEPEMVKEKRRVAGLPESKMGVECSLMRRSSLASPPSPGRQRRVVRRILHQSRFFGRINLEHSLIVSLVVHLLNLLSAGLASHDDLRRRWLLKSTENRRRPLSSCLIACQMGIQGRGGHTPAHAVSGVTSLLKLKHQTDCLYESSRPFSLSKR